MDARIENAVAVYDKFVAGEISRERVEDCIEDWETVSQIGSARRARASNEQNGYAGEELAEVL